jgi:hypothetical protein
MKITKAQLKQIIKEEFELVLEKDDRCTRIAKSKYDVWPSAYASGAVVRCRKGEIWKDLKEEEEGSLEPQIRKVLKDEGGAAGLDAIVNAVEADEEQVEQMLAAMADVGLHEDGDYILQDEGEIEIEKTIDEKKKKAGTESSKESSLRDWFGRKGAKGKKGGWVDCNAPDGDGGYKACGREDGEKRSKYPACRPTPSACKEKGKGKSWGKKAKKEGLTMNRQRLKEIIMEELGLTQEEFYEVDALSENEDYCPECAEMEEAKKKKACKPSKGKRFAKRVDGKCRSYGQAGQAKGGGDRIRPGTKKGDAYCARSAGIKKCKNPPCANTLSRKKWKCRGKKSMKS